jgi:ParB family transcriptional regulator, chromosome partitioning protein
LRRKLGRGLGSLISSPVQVEVPPQPVPRTTEVSKAAAIASPVVPSNVKSQVAILNSPEAVDAVNQIQLIPITLIKPNPKQPRQHFDASALEALASSIRTSGLMQPIVVRPAAGLDSAYQLIAGERRWRAAQLVGLATIPALVRDVDDRTAAEFSLVENLQREDLNPIERAEAFARLINEFHFTHQEIAQRVGLDRTSITNHLRLNELDADTKIAMQQGALSMGQAKALLAITNNEKRVRLAGLAVREGWSVRETERQARMAIEAGNDVTRMPSAGLGPGGSGGGAAGGGLAPHMADLQKRLGAHLGTRVRVQPGRNKGSGKLIIDFYSLDQFEGLLHRLGFAGDE